MLIKRKILGLNCLNCINDILNSDSDLGEGIWKILSSKSDNIPIGHKIEANDLEFIEVPNYKVIFALREKQAYETKNMKILESNKERINNAYGKASILVLLGSLFITMGVILSIIKIIGGM